MIANDTGMFVAENSGIILDAKTRMFIMIGCPVVIQGVNLFGILSNVINFICFAKQGLKEAINISFMGKYLKFKCLHCNVFNLFRIPILKFIALIVVVCVIR